MEKQYIFLETGIGLGVLGIGTLLLFAEAMALAVWSPLGRMLDSILVIIGVFVVTWCCFKADKWSLKRRRQREGQAT